MASGRDKETSAKDTENAADTRPETKYHEIRSSHYFFVQYSALLMDRDMYTGSEQVPDIQALSETGIHSRGASSHKYIAAPTHAGSSNFCPWRTLSDKHGQKL